MSLKGQSRLSLQEDAISTGTKVRSTLVSELPKMVIGFVAIAYALSGWNRDATFLLRMAAIAFAIWLLSNFRCFYRLWRIRRELARRRA